MFCTEDLGCVKEKEQGTGDGDRKSNPIHASISQFLYEKAAESEWPFLSFSFIELVPSNSWKNKIKWPLKNVKYDSDGATKIGLAGS